MTSSPATMPHTPSGFQSAVNLPNLTVSCTLGGTCGLAKLSDTWKNILESFVWSSNGWRCSTVIPDGPPAASRLADLKILRNRDSSKLNGVRGRCLTNSGGRGTLGSWASLTGPSKPPKYAENLGPLVLSPVPAWRKTTLPNEPALPPDRLCC